MNDTFDDVDEFNRSDAQRVTCRIVTGWWDGQYILRQKEDGTVERYTALGVLVTDEDEGV